MPKGVRKRPPRTASSASRGRKIRSPYASITSTRLPYGYAAAKLSLSASEVRAHATSPKNRTPPATSPKARSCTAAAVTSSVE
jgi:hypothetical protein